MCKELTPISLCRFRLLSFWSVHFAHPLSMI
nr:MAG TPA: hypothetical protein [Caudoviricetes sp.]